MGNYSLSLDGTRVVFTSVGHDKGDGVWIADLERRSPPRQLTRGGELRAFFGAPGEVVYMGQGNRLYRMKEDGSGAEMVSPDPIVYLMTVSPEGRWAAVMTVGSTMGFFSLRGEQSMKVCNDACSSGPRSVLEVMPFNWSADGKSIFVNLSFFGKRTNKTVVLPYRADVAFETLWPKGLSTEEDVAANPGARVIDERLTFPASDTSSHLSLRMSFQSNLYRIRLPN